MDFSHKGEAFIEREQKSTPAKTGAALLEKHEIVSSGGWVPYAVSGITHAADCRGGGP
jgi:hypothetical protein